MSERDRYGFGAKLMIVLLTLSMIAQLIEFVMKLLR